MTKYYLAIKWMKVLTHTSILMSTEKTHTCGGELYVHRSYVA